MPLQTAKEQKEEIITTDPNPPFVIKKTTSIGVNAEITFGTFFLCHFP